MTSSAFVLIAAFSPIGGAADVPWRPCVARVVDGVKHEAVAGVEVYWVDRDELSENDKPFVRERELVPEEWIRRLGHHAKSDAAGDVELPLDRHCRIVVAWHDGKFARFDTELWDFGTRVLPLELEEDPSQLVRVVDGAGAPLPDIEVAAWCEVTSYCGNGGPNDNHIWMGSTDARGEVKLPHAEWFFQNAHSPRNHERPIHVVGLGFPVRDPKWCGLEARRGDPPVIELVAPPLEPREIELQLKPEERCKVPIWTSLASLEVRKELDPNLGMGSPFGCSLARDGRLSLRHVERGFPLVVSFASDPVSGWWWLDSPVSAAAPGSPDAVETALANCRTASLHARAVDRDRRPWANACIAIDLAPIDPAEDASDVQFASDLSHCDADGRFSCATWAADLRDPPVGPRPTWLVGLRIEEGEFSRATGTPVRVSGEREGESNVIDLGDIMLTSPTLRVAGRAVDEAGRPLRGVRIRARSREAAEASSCEGSILPTTTDDGRFTIHEGEFEKGICFTSAEPGWQVTGVRSRRGASLEPPMTPVALGSSDVDVVFTQCPGLRGRVLFADGMRARDIELDLESSSQSPRLDFYPDGLFEARDSRGVVKIMVRSKSSSQLLGERIAELPESGLVDDPGLVIDLRPPPRRR